MAYLGLDGRNRLRVGFKEVQIDVGCSVLNGHPIPKP
jgi:hypothetical protein